MVLRPHRKFPISGAVWRNGLVGGGADVSSLSDHLGVQGGFRLRGWCQRFAGQAEGYAWAVRFAKVVAGHPRQLLVEGKMPF